MAAIAPLRAATATPTRADSSRYVNPSPLANREPLLHLLPSFHAEQLDAHKKLNQMWLPGQLPPLGVLDTIEDGSAPAQPGLASIGSALPLSPEAMREKPDTKTRLVQLSSLLADPKLRKALEGFKGA